MKKYFVCCLRYGRCRVDYHDVKSYILEETDNDYTALEADIAPAFGSAARAVTYYHAILFDWYKSKQVCAPPSSWP